MARYVILMTSPEGVWEALSEAEQAAVVAEHEKFGTDLEAKGALVCSYRLGEPGEARTVRRDAGGELSVGNAPLGGKGEVIGGFYVIEAGSMDEALDWAKRCRFIEGANEVRPLWD